MDFRADGDLVPFLKGDCLTDCGLCLRVCPFVTGMHDPRPLNETLYGWERDQGAIFHQHIGWYSRCYVGYSAVDGHRRAGASGGLVTWALESLLKRRIIDKAAVVTRSYNDNRLFKFSIATSQDQIRAAAGSVYYPVEISELLRLWLNSPAERWAVVGLPCLVHAIRRASMEIPRIRQCATVLLGLSCGMLQNRYYTELLIAASGSEYQDVKRISYRGKSAHGNPGNYLFSVMDARGHLSKQIPYESVPYYLGRNGYFRLNACNYCMDVFAEAADACFMDAWLPEYRNEPRGTSIVVIRSQLVRALCKHGEEAGEINIDRITGEKVCQTQAGQIRRKREHIGMRLAASNHRPGVRAKLTGTSNCSARFTDRLDWSLQRRAQQRSKKSWRRWGQRHGLSFFWLSMANLVIAKAMLTGASRLASRLKSAVLILRH